MRGMADIRDSIEQIDQPIAGPSTSTCSNFGITNNLATTNILGGTTVGTVNVTYSPVIGTCSPIFNDGRIKTLKSRHNCIVAMQEYANKSLEELRFEDYMSNRKVSILSGSAAPVTTATTLNPFGEKQTSCFDAIPQATLASLSEQQYDLGQDATTSCASQSADANMAAEFEPLGFGTTTDMKNSTFGFDAGSTSSMHYQAFGDLANAGPQVSVGDKTDSSGISTPNIHSSLFVSTPTGFGQPVSTGQQNFASSLLGNTPNEQISSHDFGTPSNIVGGIQPLGSAFGIGGLSARKEQPSIAQLLLLNSTTPYGDNPLFKDIRRSEVESPKTQPSSPVEYIAGQSLTTRHGNRFRRQLGNKSPFEGLEDLVTSRENFMLKPSPKRLTLISRKPNEITRPNGDSAPSVSEKPLDSERRVQDNEEEDFEENPMHISLKRFGYYTVPSMEDLKSFTAEDGSCIVPTFTIGHKDYGNIYFEQEMDVSGLNLDEIVHFDHNGVTIYPNGNLPPVGEGLHRTAQVTLHNIWPVDKTYRVHIKDPQRLALMGWEERLKRVCAKLETRFVEYRPATGSWVFTVEVEKNQRSDLGKSNTKQK